MFQEQFLKQDLPKSTLPILPKTLDPLSASNFYNIIFLLFWLKSP